MTNHRFYTLVGLIILLMGVVGLGIYTANLSVPEPSTYTEENVQRVIEQVEESVIGITCRVIIKDGAIQVEDDYSFGSAVVYERKGSAVAGYTYSAITNRHVVTGEEGTNIIGYKIYAYLGYDDVEVACSIVGYDTKVDVAVVRFSTRKYIEPVKIGDSAKITKGSFAIAIGNPDGYAFYGAATLGIISGIERYIATDTDNDGINDFYAEYIQHDVAINPGNSGGGLFNLKGELIGINTLKLVADTIEGMGFAIPSNVVKLIVKDYVERGVEIVRPRLGVLGSEIRALSEYVINQSPDIISIPDIYDEEQSYGIYVTEIYPNTTIAHTPITIHDIILSVNDIKITRIYVITAKLNSLIYFSVGDVIEITYYERASNTIKTTETTLIA